MDALSVPFPRETVCGFRLADPGVVAGTHPRQPPVVDRNLVDHLAEHFLQCAKSLVEKTARVSGNVVAVCMVFLLSMMRFCLFTGEAAHENAIV
jgi:hypothetical protein